MVVTTGSWCCEMEPVPAVSAFVVHQGKTGLFPLDLLSTLKWQSMWPSLPSRPSAHPLVPGAVRAGLMHVVFCLWAGGRWPWPSRITGVRAVASGLILVSGGTLTCSWRVGKNL